MSDAKILEIFRSVQGEGKYAGVDQVFVRFFECNMHCVWCDTPHSIGDGKRDYQKMDTEDVFHQIFQLWDNCHSVSFTGGEPLLQKDRIKELLPRLKEKGMKSYLDTNGTLSSELNDIIGDIDIIAMDIKLPSSTKQRGFWDEHKEFLKISCQKEVFIKTVITSDTQKEEILKAADLVAAVDPDIFFYLQPNWFEIKNGAIEQCLSFQKDCDGILNNVRVLPQIHKIMKVR